MVEPISQDLRDNLIIDIAQKIKHMLRIIVFRDHSAICSALSIAITGLENKYLMA